VAHRRRGVVDHPEVIWLAEAFTKPAMMHTLGKAGFQQSYTYYAWRNAKWELEDYCRELAGDAAAYMRPSFWPTTHDILTPYMQYGGPTAWKLRAALAATLVPTYGIYTGYELMESVARPGVEEQIDNEKYEYKDRRWADYEPGGPKDGQSLAGYLTRLNEIRRAHPALHWLRNLHFHHADDENILASPRAASCPTAARHVIVVANLDPHSTRESLVHLDMPALGLEWWSTMPVHDLVTDAWWDWGQEAYVRLGPRHRARAHRRSAELLACRERPRPRRAGLTRSARSRPDRAACGPRLVPHGGLLRGARARLRRLHGSGSGDFARPHRQTRLPAVARRRLPVDPPFYASPLRDGGYDIADYTAVLPEFGTSRTSRELVAQAHARGIRIITDLVMNHTSDQHPWFQASRSDPDGPYGDYYVWSDTDEKYAGTRIIFVDTESSNWTFDPVRRQFYWHRFFSHQPDLNFENPAVEREMFDVVRFWMDMGIDGFRLDAVPYLFEEEGHNGENHPRPTSSSRELRAMVDREYPGRVLLAEANQLPAEVVDYFGTEQDARVPHVLPLPRHAAASTTPCAARPRPRSSTCWPTPRRSRRARSGARSCATTTSSPSRWSATRSAPRCTAGTPPIRGCEPTSASAVAWLPCWTTPGARLELIHALLLSLPGSPCLYYGDEIGMGDNIWLNDRDAVRTPMQWTPDRNAGFSTADPGKLYLPVVTSLVYNYSTVNVEAQMAHGSSLLHWVRAILRVRSAHPVFGIGDFRVVPTDNPAVLAYLRAAPEVTAGARTVLCLANLSARPQAVAVSLAGAHAGQHLRDLAGGAAFPRVGRSGRVHATLAGRGHLWLRLDEEAVE
jgi:maltose alpha-D-glucosyltransferase/alpha-amylase